MNSPTFAKGDGNPPESVANAVTLAGATDRRRRLGLLRRMALLCAVLVLVVTSLSAYIRLSKAGLSCADWPQCYGREFREMQRGLSGAASEREGNAVARPLHRLVATTTLFLVLAMLMLCLARRPTLRRETWLAGALLVLALFLAVLGRWSGNARVPAVAMGNLLGGFAMLALCWLMAHRGAGSSVPWLRAWAWFCLALLTFQVALGGLVSASYAAMSCSGLNDCIAASAGIPWNALDPWREPALVATSPFNASGVLIQAAHWLLGLALAPVALLLGLAAVLKGPRRAGLRLIGLLAGELLLGLLIADNPEALALTLGHNVVAALLVATTLDLAAGHGCQKGELDLEQPAVDHRS